jgi:hypothetical protein
MAKPRFGGEDCQLARLPAIAALGLAFRIAARLAARGTELELCGIFGDGVNQAAALVAGANSIPSWNVTRLTTSGN